MQKKKIQEIELEKFKNEKLNEIEEAENLRILSMEKNITYLNAQKFNYYDDINNNQLILDQSPTKAHGIVNK